MQPLHTRSGESTGCVRIATCGGVKCRESHLGPGCLVMFSFGMNASGFLVNSTCCYQAQRWSTAGVQIGIFFFFFLRVYFEFLIKWHKLLVHCNSESLLLAANLLLGQNHWRVCANVSLSLQCYFIDSTEQALKDNSHNEFSPIAEEKSDPQIAYQRSRRLILFEIPLTKNLVSIGEWIQPPEQMGWCSKSHATRLVLFFKKQRWSNSSFLVLSNFFLIRVQCNALEDAYRALAPWALQLMGIGNIKRLI